ncbi:MAG: hypothetical protein AAF718_17120 [Pseudomonadota bacterium]
MFDRPHTSDLVGKSVEHNGVADISGKVVAGHTVAEMNATCSTWVPKGFVHSPSCDQAKPATDMLKVATIYTAAQRA